MAFLTLRCRDCEHEHCSIARDYVAEGSLEGCRRKVPEDIMEHYIHIFSERVPFMKHYSKEGAQELYVDAITLLENIYTTYPIDGKLDSKGKLKYRYKTEKF